MVGKKRMISAFTFPKLSRQVLECLWVQFMTLLHQRKMKGDLQHNLRIKRGNLSARNIRRVTDDKMITSRPNITVKSCIVAYARVFNCQSISYTYIKGILLGQSASLPTLVDSYTLHLCRVKRLIVWCKAIFHQIGSDLR